MWPAEKGPVLPLLHENYKTRPSVIFSYAMYKNVPQNLTQRETLACTEQNFFEKYQHKVLVMLKSNNFAKRQLAFP